VASIVALALTVDAPDQIRVGLVGILATVLPYGLVGAALISRRPDLPFGWLLSAAAATQVFGLATVGPAWVAANHGHSGPLVLLGMSMASLGFVPIAVQGLVNVRFPAGRPATHWVASWGRAARKACCRTPCHRISVVR
jgi:hypothetical protein